MTITTCPQPRCAQSMQRAVGEPQAVFIRTLQAPEVSCSTGHIEDQILLSRNTEPTAQICMFRGSGANGDVPAPVKRQQTRGLVQISCPEVLLHPKSVPLLVSQSGWLLLELPSPQMAMSPPKFVSPGQTTLQSPRLIYSHHLKKTLFLRSIHRFKKKLILFLHFTFFNDSFLFLNNVYVWICTCVNEGGHAVQTTA